MSYSKHIFFLLFALTFSGCAEQHEKFPTTYLECLSKAVTDTKHPVAFGVALEHCEKLDPQGMKTYSNSQPFNRDILLPSGNVAKVIPEKTYVACLENAVLKTQHQVAFGVAMDLCERYDLDGARVYNDRLQGTNEIRLQSGNKARVLSNSK